MSISSLFWSLPIVFIVSRAASAQSIAERKAVKAGDERIATAVEKFKKACGAKELKVNSAHAASAKLKYQENSPITMIESSADRCAEAIEIVADYCQRDEMNKAEMGKLAGVNCTYRIIEKRPFWIVTKKATVLNVEMHPQRTFANEQYDIVLDAF